MQQATERATELSGTKTEIPGDCAVRSTIPGYLLSPDEHLAAAQRLGAQMARSDDESQMDAAQDAALVYLEESRGGTQIVRRSRIKHRLLWRRGDSGHHRPLLSRSYAEGLEPLPEWAT